MEPVIGSNFYNINLAAGSCAKTCPLCFANHDRAQQLYESGLITYMRTDSVNLSKLALGSIKEEIESHTAKND